MSNQLTTKGVHKRSLKLMGNHFELGVQSDNETWAHRCMDAGVKEIQRIESLLSTFQETSQTNEINRMAGIKPVWVDREVFEIISRSIRISELTQGAFDITYGSMDKRLWNFDQQMTSLPDAATAKKMVRLINYRNVVLNEKAQTVFLKEKGMRIGFGGIGKGYAADKAKLIMKEQGVTSGFVNAAGDLTTWGHQRDGKPWTVGIADPDSAHHPFSYLNISDKAVATSGTYEKFVTINGKRYSHTIDPHTGYPVHGIKSVTVISPYAELSDALTTPVMVMGVKTGLDLINQMKHVSCILIDDNNRLFTSRHIRIKS